MTETNIDCSTDNILKKRGAEKPPLFVPEYVFAVDPSLRKPGFAIIQLHGNGHMKLIATNFCDNSRKKGSNGLLLTAIVAGLKAMVSKLPDGAKVTFVRERMFSRFPNETQALAKVIGVLDYVLTKDIISNPKRTLDINPDCWLEIAPKSVKAIVAGSGSASKDEVQKALEDFVGANVYRTLDESDATAVGVAYLMMNGLGKSQHEDRTYMPPAVRGKKGTFPNIKKQAKD